MLNLAEIVRSVYGAWRLAHLDPAGMTYFDRTEEGFWRSFRVAILVAPAYALLIALDYATPSADPAAPVATVSLFRLVAIESIAYAIRKAGAPSGQPEPAKKIARSEGPRPGGTISKQETATVTLTAIDQNVPSVTVLTEDGRKASFRVDDKKNLEGVKVGDKVEVTYTQAVMISVK